VRADTRAMTINSRYNYNTIEVRPWGCNIPSTSQEIPPNFMRHENSLPYSKDHANSHGHEPDQPNPRCSIPHSV